MWLALTTFMREQFIKFGAPADRIVVKANSVQRGEPDARPREGVFWGGRLSPEKGILQLMRAWPADGPVLTVAGGGPLEPQVHELVRGNVRYLGHLPLRDMRRALRSAAVVAMPSISPEPLPLVALEAFAEGTPVVSFEGWSLGAVVSELSPRCVLPLHDFAGLAHRAAEISEAPDWDDLNASAAQLWERRYSHPVNVASLRSIYRAAIAVKRGEMLAQDLPGALAGEVTS